MNKPPGRAKYDWGSVTDEQWQSMTNPEIARMLGIERSSTVAGYRTRKGLPSAPRAPKATKYDWDSVTDEQWRSMTNPEIARMLGIERSSTVSNYRTRKGLPRAPRAPKATKYDWDSVTDEQWQSMTNPEIARMLGIEGSSTVSNYRTRKGLPRAPRAPRAPKATKYDWDSVTDEQWQSMTNPEIARMLGIEGSSTVAAYRTRNDLPRGPRETKYDWDSVTDELSESSTS
ncbi:MAG: hypothetical protein ROD09_17675 [Candidatus Sedimenticola sp. (ex Thyasira tokunagai)]